MNTDIYTYVHTYHGRVDVGEVLLVLVLLTCCEEWRNKGEGWRREKKNGFLSCREREIGSSIDSAHSQLFIIHFTLLGGSINRISSAQDREDRPSVLFLAVGHFDLLSFLRRTGKKRSSSCTNTEGAVVGLLRSRRHAPVITYHLWLRGRTGSILLLLRTFVHLASPQLQLHPPPRRVPAGPLVCHIALELVVGRVVAER